MATCTKETGKCPICNNQIVQLPSLVVAMTGKIGFYCDNCCISFEKFPTCNGEIEKVWKDGKEIDCACQKCGKHYGKGYLDGLKLHDSLIGANIRF